MPLTLDSIGFAFGRTDVLKDLSLQLEDGEWLGLIGANGSGRSTLAEMAAGLRRPHHGRVLLDHQNIWGRHGAALRRRLGLVMQRAEDQFLGETVAQDVAFGPRQVSADPAWVDSATRKALLLVGFELDAIGSRSPLEFSGGQRRRLAVAGLLALDPVVLVLDEPFAGLDARARSDMVELLCRLRDQRMTILTLTSDLESVSEASRMGLLVKGRVGLIGDLKDFVANQLMCREAGVLLPERIRLALQLRERGWDVPVLGPPDALETAIAGEWRHKKGA